MSNMTPVNLLAANGVIVSYGCEEAVSIPKAVAHSLNTFCSIKTMCHNFGSETGLISVSLA